MDINQAVQEVLKVALVHDGLRRGLKEVLKTIEAGEALLCILAQVRSSRSTDCALIVGTGQ